MALFFGKSYRSSLCKSKFFSARFEFLLFLGIDSKKKKSVYFDSMVEKFEFFPIKPLFFYLILLQNK